MTQSRQRVKLPKLLTCRSSLWQPLKLLSAFATQAIIRGRRITERKGGPTSDFFLVNELSEANSFLCDLCTLDLNLPRYAVHLRDVWISSRRRSFLWTVTWSTLLIEINFEAWLLCGSQLLCTVQKTQVLEFSAGCCVFCTRLSEWWLIRMCQHHWAAIRAVHRPEGRQSSKPPVANAFKNFPRI